MFTKSPIIQGRSKSQLCCKESNQFQQLKKKFMLEDEMGKKMPALDVFAACITYMKNGLLADVKKQLHDIRESEIRWVITVPAIWNDNSKQFMREATEMVWTTVFYLLPHNSDF